MALLGEIRTFAGNFAPKGWAFCAGQSLSIAQNTALFSLLGTTYGGNGVTTFNLPDLRGRIPMHAGSNLGQTQVLGAQGGSEQVALQSSQMPSHNHTLQGADAGSVAGPGGNFWAGTPALEQFAPPSAANATLNSAALAAAGSGTAHENRPPVLAVNFIIALAGIFPSRN